MRRACNDTNVIDRTSGITVTELSGEDTDPVQASVTHTLASNVENLTLTDSSAVNGTGNTSANAITGSCGSQSACSLRPMPLQEAVAILADVDFAISAQSLGLTPQAATRLFGQLGTCSSHD